MILVVEVVVEVLSWGMSGEWMVVEGELARSSRTRGRTFWRVPQRGTSSWQANAMLKSRLSGVLLVRIWKAEGDLMSHVFTRVFLMSRGLPEPLFGPHMWQACDMDSKNI